MMKKVKIEDGGSTDLMGGSLVDYKDFKAKYEEVRERLANGESKEELKKEYTEKVASPFTAAACGAVDDIFAPADIRAKVIAALDILAGKRENTLPRKHSVK